MVNYMKLKKGKLLIVLIFIVALLSSCNKNDTNMDEIVKEKEDKIIELEEEIRVLEDKIKSYESGIGTLGNNNLLRKVIEIIELIKEKDMNMLSSYVHPTKGLRFAPYPFIDITTSQVFTAQQVANLYKDDSVYMWGSYDGSGEPINLTFDEYYNRFIYDVNFANPDIIGNNITVSQGNDIDNVKEIYPSGYFVELYITGVDPQYEGIDWRSLKLVFEQLDDEWYLVGIIHGEWTI